MNRPSSSRVAIVGGGLSGLATAAQMHLADPSISLSVFESGPRIGGVIDTEVVDGYILDQGADMFATQPPAAIELIRQLGLEDRLIEPEPTRRGARIVHRGRLVPVPEGFVLMRATQLIPMLTTPLLGLTGKVRFLLERFAARRNHDGDESVRDFVLRRMGQQVLDRIVAPLAAGIYTADINKLSMRATMGPIYEMERKFGSLAAATVARRKSGQDSLERSSAGARYGKFRSFRGGMKELLESLADSLPPKAIHLNSSVTGLARSDEGWSIRIQDETTEPFDHVVLAVPPHPASMLLRPLNEHVAVDLDAIEMASAAIVVLAVPRAQIKGNIDTFGFVVPLSEGRRILAGSFASHKFAGRAPEDHVIIRVFIGGAMQPELLDHSDDELITIATDELGELIGMGSPPTIARVVRWNHAMPQYHVGHVEKVERIDNEMKSLDGISLVSNALHGVGIAPVIGLAGRVADQVVARLEESGDASSSDGVGARSSS
ncbi:MAG: protoporphyrinogen oxidase [Planctomycetota bacterium]